jgi:hypothetical protein
MEHLSITLKLAELHDKYLTVGIQNQQQRQKETKLK